MKRSGTMTLNEPEAGADAGIDASGDVAQLPGAPDREGYSHYRIGEVRLALRSDLPDVLEEFAWLYAPIDPASAAPTDDSTVIRMEVRQGRRTAFGRRTYEISGDGVAIKTVRSRRELLPYLEWGINYRLIARASRFLQLHAASLVRRGKGFIFCGMSGAGKSTLAAALLSRGWTYLCDEFALIHRQTHRLHAFPKALCIKAGSFDLVGRMGLPLVGGRCYVKALKGRVAYVNPPRRSLPKAGAATAINYIFFPSYTGNASPRTSAVKPARAMMALASQALNRNVVGLDTVPILSRIVRDAQCYSLESGPLEATCELIESLAG
ncbi:MAG: hypothetical protein WD768_19235 [Phycisphaeraceae bacterium]